MKHFFLYTLSLWILSFCFFSCQKSDNHDVVKLAYDNPKVIRFLSVITQMPIESIKVDYNSKEFYISNSDFRRKIEDIEREYANANVYKLIYEK